MKTTELPVPVGVSRLVWSAALLAILLCATPSRADTFQYTAGHADIAVGYHDGTMELFYGFEQDNGDDHVGGHGGDSDHDHDGHDHGSYFARHPHEVITVVSGPSIPRRSGSEYDRIGNGAGDPLWYLPAVGGEAETQGKPFLGISTTPLDGDHWGGGISWSIIDVVGPEDAQRPGEFSIWQESFTGANFQASTDDGLDDSDSWQQGLGGHDHHNFGFTAPGNYQVTIKASGTHVNDGLQTTNDVFTFQVVPEPSTLALVASACVFGTVPLLRRRWRKKASRESFA